MGVVRRAGAEGRGHRIVDLVVAHQDHRAVRPGKGTHPVVPTGQDRAVGEDDQVGGVVEGAVAEAFRHVETHDPVALVGDGPERDSPRVGGSVCLRGRHEAGERAGHRGGGRALQDGAPLDGLICGHGGSSRYGLFLGQTALTPAGAPAPSP